MTVEMLEEPHKNAARAFALLMPIYLESILICKGNYLWKATGSE
jgi:hypothetical protein